jgi:hypothetical protein
MRTDLNTIDDSYNGPKKPLSSFSHSQLIVNNDRIKHLLSAWPKTL